jgi:hypothetical protein
MLAGKARHVQVRKPASIQPFLDTRTPLVIDVDVTDKVRDFSAVRVNALVLRQEAHSWNPEAMNLLALRRSDFSPQPDKPAPGAPPLAQLRGVDIGQQCGAQIL